VKLLSLLVRLRVGILYLHPSGVGKVHCGTSEKSFIPTFEFRISRLSVGDAKHVPCTSRTIDKSVVVNVPAAMLHESLPE
jgi:hypothetical protein